MFAYFSKNDIFTKKETFFFTATQKTLFFWAFFEIVLSIFFSYCPFYLFQHKKDKTKSAHFFSKTLFGHPDKLLKNYFRTPTHYLCFFRPAKNTIKLGKTSKKKSWTDFQRNLGRIFNSKTPKSWTDFQLYSIYIYAVGSISWPHFGHFKVNNLATVRSITWPPFF